MAPVPGQYTGPGLEPSRTRAPEAPLPSAPARASGWACGLGRMIDVGLAVAIGGTVAVIESALFGNLAWPANRSGLDAVGTWVSHNGDPLIHGSIAGAASALALCTTSLSLWGQTFGQRLTGTVLGLRDGSKVPWWRLGLWLVMGWVSNLPAGLGTYWMIVDAEHHTLADRLLGVFRFRARTNRSVNR